MLQTCIPIRTAVIASAFFIISGQAGFAQTGGVQHFQEHEEAPPLVPEEWRFLRAGRQVSERSG
jgi:hypothetical protein